MDHKYTSFEWATNMLPRRKSDANKGTYGRLFAYVGSRAYHGAAHLAIEAALRGGVGYTEAAVSGELRKTLLIKFPELIFKDFDEASALSQSDMERLVAEQRRATATLVGCGSSKSQGLFDVVSMLLSEDGGALVLDADAINSMADNREEALSLLKNAKRKVVLTPHPLEFSRLSGLDTSYINENRMAAAVAFAAEHNCVLLLKGHGTVITDGQKTYINTSGSSALAKAGSGDTLAGLLSALLATSVLPPLELSALAAYVHGAAADKLSKELSEYGVTPSDLPKEMAKMLALIEKETKKDG